MSTMRMAIIVSLLATVMAASSAGRKATTAGQRRVSCADAKDSTWSMFVPLVHARYFGGVDLMLNNRGVEPAAVSPTWYVEGQGAVTGRIVTLPASQAGFHAIQEFLPEGIHLNQVEGLELTYVGKTREVWAQAVLRPKRQAEPSQSLDDPFSMTSDFKSNRLETVWPQTRGNESVIIAMANVSDQPLTVEVTDNDSHSTVHLRPHSGKAHQTVAHGGSVGWVRLKSDGAPGALRATGFVQSRADNVPRLTRFFDPAAPLQAHLFAPGLELKNADVTIALKNTSDSPLTATAQLLAAEDGQVIAEMPPVSIPGGSAALVRPDLPGGRASRRVSVRVLNTGEPGSLIGTLHSTNRVTHLGYEMPLRDSGAARASTGGYPWRLDDDYQTVVSITNVGTVPVKFAARLHYDGVDYVLKPRELPIGATALFDIRALRDGAIQDAKGQTIPRDLDHGQFYWSIRDAKPGAHLAGRAEIVSRSQNVSSSFSCWMCCPDTYQDSFLQIGQSPLGIDEWTYFDPQQWMQNCYSSNWTEPVDPDSWSYDTLLIDGPGYPGSWGATGTDAGTTTVHAYWSESHWWPVFDSYENVIDCGSEPVSPDASRDIQVVRITQNPSSMNLSTGDTGSLSVTVDPSGTSFTRSINVSPVSNQHSSCDASLSGASATGAGATNHNLSPGNAGCSRIFTVRAAVDQAQASGSTEVTIPPQIIIQMMHGEANAYSQTTQTSLGSVAWNRMVGGGGWFNVSTWQAAINGDFQGTDGTSTGISPELERAASLYRGTVGDIVGGAGCFWSPTNSEWTNIANAMASNTTAFPSNSGAPSCYGSSGTGRQILVKAGVENNHRSGYSEAPAFVFLRPRPSAGDPAVIQY